MGRKSNAKAQRRLERVERTRNLAEMRIRAAEDGRRRGCLFCRGGDGPFTAPEHAVPESLGNTEKVLPPGVVCDPCNHGICSQLDEALINFPPVALLRTTHGIRSKSGKPPKTAFDNGTISSDGDGNVFLQLDSEKWTTPAAPTGDGRVEWQFTSQMSGMTPKRFALVHRALVKVTMELAWLDHGEIMLDAHFDRERRLVMQGGHAGYIATLKHLEMPDPPASEITYQFLNTTATGEHLTGIGAQLFGVPWFTDTLFDRPQVELPPDTFVVLEFDAKDLRGAPRSPIHP